MAERYKISVVMPAYNAGRFIGKAIDTILNQTYRNIELLIMDDASKDDTVKIVQSFKDSRIRLFYNEKNLGYLKTCNKLFDLAAGEFITFQDADDYSDLRRLEIQMNEFEKERDLMVCGTNLTAVHEDGTLMFCSHYFCDQKTIAENMLDGHFAMIPNSFLFKREILSTIGKYNEYWDRIGAEDYYWAWLIIEKYKLINIHLPLYFYRYHPHGVTGDWSDNPRKLHTLKVLNYLLKERIQSGTDSLEKGDLRKLHDLVREWQAPYNEDASLFYRELARRDFYRGYKKRALTLMMKAITNNPVKPVNYKDFLYYLRAKPG